MRLQVPPRRKARIEMLPLIDIVFLLLVFFIYAMLSMAVHRGLPVQLPASTAAKADQQDQRSVTLKADGSVFVDKAPVPLARLEAALQSDEAAKREGILLFADRSVSYQRLFEVLDRIHQAGIVGVSLQAENGRSGP